MSFKAEQTDIEQFFRSGWPYTVIAFDNVEFNPAAYNEWVRFVIRNGNARQSSIAGNNPGFRYYGVIYVQIFTRASIGTGRALELADFVTGLFRSANVNGIQFKTPSITRVGNMEDSWFQINVDCPYYREEF
jgi:hypothetical protein